MCAVTDDVRRKATLARGRVDAQGRLAGNGLAREPQRAHPRHQPVIEKFKPRRRQIAAGKPIQQQTANIECLDRRIELPVFDPHVEHARINPKRKGGAKDLMQPFKYCYVRTHA